MKKISSYKHWIFIAIFWFALGFAIWAQSVQELSISYAIFQTLLVVGSSILIAHTLSDILLPKALVSGKMKIFVFQSVVMTILLSFLLTTIFILFEVSGFRPDALSKLSFGEYFWFRIYTSIPASLLINGTACGLRFYQEHSVIEKKHTQLKQSHLEAQIKILQDQINPHLMFNVLNHIHILMQRNVDLASELLIKFSDILRYQLYECNREYVLLDREIKYLKDLVGVEQIRWGNELDVYCKWDIKNGNLQIVPLLLMPLIENAFKHVSRLPHEKGYVNLLCTQEEHNFTLKIENSYTDQYKSSSNDHGLGLDNVRKRLNIQYPDKHNLTITKTEDKFTIILTLVLN
jgi:sensor histidine kinase YesM